MISHVRRWVAITLALLLLPVWATAQQPVTITGRVIGEQGEALQGANVQIPDLNISTATDIQGNYRLTVPGARAQGQQVTIRARMIGYRSQIATVDLTPGATIERNFQIVPDPLRLEEVVVTGAGTEARAERLGTARSTVTQEMVQRANEPNVIAALAQKAPNVITTQASGEAGAGTSIRIRGTSTFGLGQPAIIVDGMLINNTSRSTGNPQTGGTLGGVVVTNRAFDINPDDIESIEILKGPAAMSILGASAGASGAILITTRKGQAGTTRYSFRTSYQFDRPTNFVPLQNRFGSGSAGVATTCLVTLTPGCTHNNPTWGPALAAGTPTFDHSRELFETGGLMDNTLTVSGGSDQTAFYFSAGATRHDGFITGDRDKFERYTARLNANHRLRDNLRVDGNVSYVQTDGSFVSRGNNVNGLLLGSMRTPPEFNNRPYFDPVTGLHRSYRFPAPRPVIDLVNPSRGFDNPFFAIFEHPNLGEVGRVFGNVTTVWDPLPWLTVRHNLGADYANDDRTEALHVSASGAASGGTITRWQFYDRILDHSLVATAKFPVTGAIAGTFSLGQNLNETYFRQVFVNAQRLIAPQPFKLSNTVDRSPPDDDEGRRRLEGYFGQLELDIASQLFLTARLRNDGASTFGLANQRAWYPGGQLAWTFTRALNIPENVLSHGKLRLSYGESGQQPELYQLQDVFTNADITDFNPGSGIVPTLAGIGGLYTSASRGNPDIKPERVGELDTGVDLQFLGGRADLAVTYYRKDAEDVIFTVATPPSTGATSKTLNAAEIENRGWETSFNIRPFETPRVGFAIGLNWARNRNEVISLGEIAPGIPRTVTGYSSSFVGSTTHLQVGQPVGIFRGFGFVRCGISPDQVSATLNIAADCAGAPRGAIYIGTAGFPLSDPTERIIGNPNPDWTAGLNGELRFGRARITAFLDHREGGQVLNMTRGSLASLGVHGTTDIRDAAGQTYAQLFGVPVVGPGVNTVLAGNWGQTYFQGIGGLGTREQLMEDGTFTRLRELSLAYSFTGPGVQRMGISSIDARISGRNLWLRTDYTGYDPEVHTGGAAVANRGIDWFTNPASRAFVLSFGISR